MATREDTRATIWGSKVAELRDGADHLIRAHTAEVGLGDPDAIRWNVLQEAEDEGNLAVLIARVHGVDVGYLLVSFGPNIWDEARMLMDIMAVYVDPEWRGVGIMRRLVDRAEATGRSRGCTRAGASVPTSPDTAWGRFEHLGYVAGFVQMTKEL